MEEMNTEYENFAGMADWVLNEMNQMYLGKVCNLDSSVFSTENTEVHGLPDSTDFEITEIKPIGNGKLGVKLTHNGTVLKTWFYPNNIRNIRE